MSNPEFDAFEKYMSDQGCDVNDLNKKYYLPDLRVVFIEGRDLLKKKYETHAEIVKGLVEAVEKACQPEPDGLGGFVDDEFERPEILKLRQALTNYRKLKGE